MKTTLFLLVTLIASIEAFAGFSSGALRFQRIRLNDTATALVSHWVDMPATNTVALELHFAGDINSYTLQYGFYVDVANRTIGFDTNSLVTILGDSFYTKDGVDELFEDYYTKTETDALLDGKLDIDGVAVDSEKLGGLDASDYVTFPLPTVTTNDVPGLNTILATIPAARKSFGTNVTTSASGTYTWTFPSAFNNTPIINCSPEDNTAGIRYDWKVTSKSTTSVSVLITRRQDQLISLLGLNIGVNAATAATAISLHAEEQH